MKALFTHFALVPSLFTMIPYHVVLQSSYSKWFLTIITCHNIISDSIVFICQLFTTDWAFDFCMSHDDFNKPSQM